MADGVGPETKRSIGIDWSGTCASDQSGGHAAEPVNGWERLREFEYVDAAFDSNAT